MKKARFWIARTRRSIISMILLLGFIGFFVFGGIFLVACILGKTENDKVLLTVLMMLYFLPVVYFIILYLNDTIKNWPETKILELQEIIKGRSITNQTLQSLIDKNDKAKLGEWLENYNKLESLK